MFAEIRGSKDENMCSENAQKHGATKKVLRKGGGLVDWIHIHCMMTQTRFFLKS